MSWEHCCALLPHNEPAFSIHLVTPLLVCLVQAWRPVVNCSEVRQARESICLLLIKAGADLGFSEDSKTVKAIRSLSAQQESDASISEDQHMNVTHGESMLVSALVECDARSKDTCVPLFQAVFCNFPRVVEALIHALNMKRDGGGQKRGRGDRKEDSADAWTQSVDAKGIPVLHHCMRMYDTHLHRERDPLGGKNGYPSAQEEAAAIEAAAIIDMRATTTARMLFDLGARLGVTKPVSDVTRWGVGEWRRQSGILTTFTFGFLLARCALLDSSHMTRFLIHACGADVNGVVQAMRDDLPGVADDRTPVHIASHGHNVKILSILLNAGGNPNQPSWRSRYNANYVEGPCAHTQ